MKSYMQKAALLFFILLSLVVIRTYAEPIATDARSSTPALDDSPNPNDSRSRSFLSLRLETYQPWGQGVFSDQSTANLANFGSILLPTVVYGALSEPSSLGEFQTNYGLEASASYISQSTTLISSSGLAASAQLETWVASVKPIMRFHWRTKQKVYTRISGEVGYEQINLYSAGSVGSLGHNSGFIGYGLGIEWDPFERYGVVFDYYSRIGINSAQNGWTPAASSYQLGALFFF